MFRKIINPILYLPLFFITLTQEGISGQKNNLLDKVLQEQENKIFINYKNIEEIILKNQELKSLQALVSAASFNLSSKISKRYPSLDIQINGFPKYVVGKNFNSNNQNTKTSQFSANPSLNFRLDLLDPTRDSEIKIAKENYKIAKNNFEIKRKDLIQEARARYHKFQKSYQDIENKKLALELSITSLDNAQSKLNAGIGTRFEVLEADAQLSRDQQLLNEKKIEHKINKISLQEILNINNEFEIKKEQKLVGYWNYKLNKNIKDGLTKNLSLQNSILQREIKKNQSLSYLNANKPNIYISNSFSAGFTKGDAASISLDSSEYGSSYTNTVSLNFSWNFFNGGQNKNSYKSSNAEAQAENFSYENLKNILKKNINTSYLNLKLNEEKILSSIKEINSTNESLRLARLRYDVGVSTLKDVLIRQKELSNAKSKNINAIYNYNLNLDELERLTFLEKSDECIENNISKTKKQESICNIKRLIN